MDEPVDIPSFQEPNDGVVEHHWAKRHAKGMRASRPCPSLSLACPNMWHEMRGVRRFGVSPTRSGRLSRAGRPTGPWFASAGARDSAVPRPHISHSKSTAFCGRVSV